MEPDRRGETYRWAARNLNLSSAAVLTGSVPAPLEELNRFTLPMALETEGWPKHTYIVTTGEHGGLVVDGRPDASVAVRFLSYSQLAAAPPQGEVLTVVKIRTDADIAALEERLARFHATGSLEVFHPDQPTVFENSCRWSRYGGCSVSMLRRLSVEKDGQVIACRDAGTIGTVGDDYDRMLARVRQDQQLYDVRRGCSTCPVRDECSHCIHLPDQWGGRYCAIRKANPQTALFFEINVFPFLVERMLPHTESVLQASVSNTGLPVQHYDGPSVERRTSIRPIIVSLSDRHFAWWRGTSRITRLSGPLALVLEGWWLGATEPGLQQALCTRFGVEPAVAESGLKEALLKLQQGGLINA
jgi:radical SAM protein with 4Fe4S-binding SPASM domain